MNSFTKVAAAVAAGAPVFFGASLVANLVPARAAACWSPWNAADYRGWTGGRMPGPWRHEPGSAHGCTCPMCTAVGTSETEYLYNYALAQTRNDRVEEAVDAWNRYLTLAEPIPEESEWVKRAREHLAKLKGR